MIEKILKKHNVYSIELEIELLRYFVEDRKKLNNEEVDLNFIRADDFFNWLTPEIVDVIYNEKKVRQ